MAKSYATPTTGVFSNGGLVQLGANNTSDQWDYIVLPKPTRPWRILIEGDLPSNSTTPTMSVSFFEGTVPLFSASGTWQTQGQSSLGADKKNWKLKLKNTTTANSLQVKVGDWFPVSSITLKGFGTDRTLVRDVLTTDMWRQIHAYPTNMMAPESAYLYWSKKDFGEHTSALFTTDGFPAEVWRNGVFLGLYIVRSSADNPDYLMDENNNQHILIQPQHAQGLWNGTFTSTDWVVQSPSIKGYDDQDDISASAPDINAACQRIIGWMGGCNMGTIDARATYPAYLDLTSFLDYVIICELSGSFDSMQNNFMFGSWNATSTSGIWHFWPYDEDETWGLVYNMTGQQSDAQNIGFVTIKGGNADQDPGFFNLAHTVFRPEMRARWAQLRDGGIISAANINRTIQRITNLIDPTMMQQDVVNWPMNGHSGAPIAMPAPNKWSVPYVMNYAATRIAWIDSQWGYSGA